MISISYCLTVCDETEEFKKLIDFLIKNIRDKDEICILVDEPKCPTELKEKILDLPLNPNIQTKNLKIKFDKFEGHFADWKNKLFDIASKEYLFFIDADEMIEKSLIEELPGILENNKIDVLGIARKNTVEGLTQEWIDKWRWNVNEDGLINWPDVQLRIISNKKDIKWQNRVHEIPSNYRTISVLPGEDYFIMHHKKLDKQIKQNELYSTL